MAKYSGKSAHGLVRLARFLFWYGAAVTLLLYGLPMLGAYLQSGYESLSGTAKLVALAGFFAGTAILHVRGRRDRLRSELAASAVENG